MSYAGAFLGSQQIRSGRLEELDRGLIELRRVGDVDDDLCAGQRRVQAFTGKRIDARIGRGSEHLMAFAAKNAHQPGADETRATNHDDFHVPLLNVLSTATALRNTSSTKHQLHVSPGSIELAIGC